jgi:hypothetical protein
MTFHRYEVKPWANTSKDSTQVKCGIQTCKTKGCTFNKEEFIILIDPSELDRKEAMRYARREVERKKPEWCRCSIERIVFSIKGMDIYDDREW